MKNWKKIIVGILIAVFFAWLVCMLWMAWDVIRMQPKVERVEFHDTLYVSKTDTLPVIRTEKVVKYISVPRADSVSNELQPDSTIPLAVVQRTYSDDSTYTAYVSGIKYEELPKLDSISVRQRTIVRDIERTITIHEQKPLTIGLQVGAGYGVINHQPDIYIGIGFQWNLK